LTAGAKELFAMDIAAICTDRLTLRGHRLEDFEPLASLWGDPVVARFIGGKPATREESWARLLKYAGHWRLLGFGYWAVELNKTGQYVGDVGFANWQRDITPPLDAIPEAGWALAPTVHGQGIATEAVQAALAWTDHHFADQLTTCLVGTANTASIRVAEKTGYREFCRGDVKGKPVIQFRR
jgi:RimJ/RimL family protein N-acetyltransferase